MLGSPHDAEDALQDTLLRAWRALPRFRGGGQLRTWLYRIATNVCLDAIAKRHKRALPLAYGTVTDASEDQPSHSAWHAPPIQPYQEGMVGSPDAVAAPEARYEQREALELAFIAAHRHLPVRQRSALILRDVLRWKAAEVAEALETSTAAVNSALQRAHAQLEGRHLTEDTVTNELTPEQNALLERYVDAFWRKDIDTIVSMLTEDATWEMPPFLGWYRGNENIGRLIDTQCPGGVHDMPMVATTANGQPAFGLYMRTERGDFVPFHLQVLTLDGERVSHVGAFFDTRLFPEFGLPERLPADHPVAT